MEIRKEKQRARFISTSLRRGASTSTAFREFSRARING
jgi:hypothetical protein